MKYGICSSDPAELKEAREAGFDYFEGWTPNLVKPGESETAFEDAAAELLAPGLPVETANGFLVKGLVCIGPDAVQDKVVEYADEVLRRLAKIGVSVCVFGSGWAREIPEGFPRAEAEKQFTDLLSRLGPLAVRHGVKIAIEPLARVECNFVNTVDEGARFARASGSAGIGALADFYHWSRNGETTETIEAAGDCFLHAHIATMPSRLSPGMEPCDFGAFFGALSSIGYDGRISVEGGRPPAGPERPAAFRKAVECLRKH